MKIIFEYLQMDYFCAFSVVLYSLLAFLLRAFGGGVSRQGGVCGSFTTSWTSLASCIGCILFFVRHVYQMAYVHFDYGHNMKVRITPNIAVYKTVIAEHSVHYNDMVISFNT